MKSLTILALAAAARAFVIPDVHDQDVLEAFAVEPQHDKTESFWDNVPNPERIWEDALDRFQDAGEAIKEHFNEGVDYTYDTAVHYGEKFEDAFAGEAWLQSGDRDTDLFDRPPHHGGPHRGHRRPHHPSHGKPNMTVYELIAKSKYTTKLAAAINEFPDLVDLLNGTKANYTVFAPTDRAFEKIPKHAPKPPKEFLKKLLTYHVSPEFYPAGRVLASRTIPTALEAEAIGKVPQRLATEIGLKGLTVNFYARVVAINIFGTNGVIHGVDSLLIPPPKVVNIIEALPGEFSTLDLALTKTGLLPAFNDTSGHNGGTLFAPSNFAFQRLGPRINAFLFSKYGQKYLKALILYHAVDNITLYSDAIYKVESTDSMNGPPKGIFHIDLPTGLEGKSLSVDIARYGRLITIKINGFTRVSVTDGVAADGVIHVLSNVLIPPKTPGSSGLTDEELDLGMKEMDLEDFKARFAPYVEEDDEENFGEL